MAGGKTGRQTVPKADFEAIHTAVSETARGRWFLAEHARRNRAADTAAVLEVLGRLEAKLAATQQPAAAAVPPPEPSTSALRPAVSLREEPPPALRELPRIPEPDFSALDQLFRSQGSEALFAPEKSPAKAAVDLDDDPWPPEADDPPAAIVSSDTGQEEDPEVEEEDIEAWEAELTEMEQPAAAAEPEPPGEFSFFRRIETRGATALNLEPMPIPVIDPPRPIASTATSWPLPKPVEQRSILPRPELARVVGEEMPRPIPVPPPVARAEPVRPAPSPVDRQEPVALGTSPLLDRLAPLRPVPPAAPALKAAPKAASVAAARPERPPSRPGPRVNDPTVTMTRDEKLSMFS